jgi:hypothetical protein
LIRLGIIGADSFHGEAFGNLCKDKESVLSHKIKIQNVWWHEKEKANELASKINANCVLNDIAEIANNVDALMLINRFGEERLDLVEEIINFKKPTFIDKPISTNIKEANKIINLYKENNVKLFSSSALRFADDVQNFKKIINNKIIVGGAFFVPAECNDLGDDARLNTLTFYGTHTTELIQEIFGRGFVLNTFKSLGERGYYALVTNSRDLNLSIHFLRNTNNYFSLHAYTKDEVFNLNINLDGCFFQRTLEKFLKFLDGEKMDFTISDTLEALELIISIENEILR